MSSKRKVSKSSRDKDRKSSRWSSSGEDTYLNSSRSTSPSPVNMEGKLDGSRVMSLSSLVNDPSLVAATATACMDWRVVEGMLPQCLKGKSRNEIVRLVTEELEGMSKKRIIGVIEGQDISWSSSSEESLSENETVKDDDSNEENVNRITSLSYLRSMEDSSASNKGGDDNVSESFSDIELIEGGVFFSKSGETEDGEYSD